MGRTIYKRNKRIYKRKKLQLVTYRPPVDLNENYQQFTDELQKGKSEVIRIFGDFNIDLLNYNQT